MSTHTSSNNKASGPPLLKMMSNRLRTMESSIQIRLNNFIPSLDRTIQDTRISGTTSICDEGIDLAKLLDDVGDELLNAGVVADVELVGFGFHAVGLGELFGVLLAAFWARGIGYCDVGAHFCTAAGGFDAHASGTGCTGNLSHISVRFA
jgi:hypothetical protein